MQSMAGLEAKHNANILASNVVFAAAPHKKVAVSILVQVKGHEFFARAEAGDAFGAFSEAFAEAEKQLAKERARTKTIERKQP
jgi:ribosome-associated translation inhibitor RaiA